MFRLRLPRLALAGSAAGAAVLPDPDKLPIYEIQAQPILLVETPSRLELQIGVARRAATDVLRDAYSRVQGVVDKWIGVEHAVENRVKSLISPSEPLTPGILYVGISTLTGSILSRSRGIPVRLILPPTFLLVSMLHFLPETSANLGAYISLLERTHFPTLAERHAKIDERVRHDWENLRKRSHEGRAKVTGTAEMLVGRIQEATGLKLREAIGLGEAVMTEAQGKVKETDVVNKLERKVESAAAGAKATEEMKRV